MAAQCGLLKEIPGTSKWWGTGPWRYMNGKTTDKEPKAPDRSAGSFGSSASGHSSSAFGSCSAAFGSSSSDAADTSDAKPDAKPDVKPDVKPDANLDLQPVRTMGAPRDVINLDSDDEE